jgi:ankyrin repeat protein
MNSIRTCAGLCFHIFRIFICLALAHDFACRAQTRPDQQIVRAVFQAIDDNDTNALMELHARNTNFVDDTYFGSYYSQHYPLLQAAADGRTAIVALLLKYGASPNVAGDTRGVNAQRTALEEAAAHGHLEICDLLLKAGANPNHQSFSGDTALHYAFDDFHGYHTNCNALAGLLLDYGANPFWEAGYYKRTPIELAITRGDGKLVARMLGQDKANPLGKKSLQGSSTSKRRSQPVKTAEEFLTGHGADLLAAAAVRGELEAVQALLRAGVSATNSSLASLTLLQSFALSSAEAAKSRPSAIDQWHQAQDRLKADFISHADPQYVASLRLQESQSAAKVESLNPARWQRIFDVLIQHGANYDAFAATALGDTNQMMRLVSTDKNVVLARDCASQTLLHWAVQNDLLPMTKFWLEAGASTAATNFAGQTALHLAAAKGLAGHLKILLAAQAPTDVRDTNGWTPLDAAIQAKQTETIRLLLNDKTTAPRPERAVAISIHEAAASGNITALAVLTETTNRLEARNELGLTPLQVAVQHGHLAAAALLVDRGADVNARDPGGNTLLQQILLQDRLTIYDRPPTNWLDRMGQDLRQTTYVKYLTVGQYEQGPNPVLQAASFLLACGVDAKTTNHAGQTAVQLVTEEKISRGIFFFDDDRATLLKLLGTGGGNVNETETDGNTALHRAAIGYNDLLGEKVPALIASGANVNATNLQGRTPLHIAVEKIGSWPTGPGGPNSSLQSLIEAKANVNAQDNDGLTPLHVLASADTSFKKEATQALLEAGANPKLGDKHGRTPAHLFVSGEWPWSEASECMGMLVKFGANLSAKDDQGKTPLHYLAALGDQKPLFFIRGIDGTFVAAKVDFQVRDNEGNTPLHIAAKTGTHDVFDWFLKQGASLDATNNLGETPRLLTAHSKNSSDHFGPSDAETDIFQAVRDGKIDSATRLLNADRQLANETNQFGQTPLRLAVMMYRTNMVELLETHGAQWDEVSAVMAGRVNALQEILRKKPSAVSSMALGKGLAHIAAANGDMDILKTLIAANCDLQAYDFWGLSPLGRALIKKNPDVLELLLQHGAKENFFDAVYANDLKTVTALLAQDKSLASSLNQKHISALNIAAAAGYTDILKALLKSGAITDVGSDQNSLHLAAFHNQTNTLSVLIRNGANVNQIDQYGFAPLHWTAIRGATETAALLLRNKADANVRITEPTPGRGLLMFLGPSQTPVGDTSLHLAVLCGQTNIIELLLNVGANVNAGNAMSQTPLDMADNMSHNSSGLRQGGMFDLLEPLGINQTSQANQFKTIREKQQVAAKLIEAAGGKRSQGGQSFRGPPGFR